MAEARDIGGAGRSFARSDVRIRQVPFDAPWAWLASGWRDLWANPSVSLGYGAIFTIVAFGLLAGLIQAGLQSLMLALAGGFILVGPLFAVGLYEASRRLETGQRVSLSEVLLAGFRAPGQLGFIGAVLAFVFFVWLQMALLLFMLFQGSSAFPPASEFVPTLLFTPHGLGLLVVGSIVGGVLAALVFAISAVSVPLMTERQVDAVTAIGVSFEAIRQNPRPMALWAVLIAAFLGFGLATLMVGVIVAFPLIGHATWHGYRALVEPGV